MTEQQEQLYNLISFILRKESLIDEKRIHILYIMPEYQEKINELKEYFPTKTLLLYGSFSLKMNVSMEEFIRKYITSNMSTKLFISVVLSSYNTLPPIEVLESISKDMTVDEIILMKMRL